MHFYCSDWSTQLWLSAHSSLLLVSVTKSASKKLLIREQESQANKKGLHTLCNKATSKKALRRLGNHNKQKYLRLCSLMKCWQKYMWLTAPLNWSYKAFDINFWRASKWRLRNNTICRLCYFSISSKEAWVLSFPKLQNDELYYLLWNLHTKIP